MDLCQNFSREAGTASASSRRVGHRSRTRARRHPAGGYVSTAERKWLRAMVLLFGRGGFETRAIGQLATSDRGETGRLHALR